MHCCITRIAAAKADSSGRRNTLMKEVAMKIQKRRSDRSGRAPLSSPGRPSVAGRDERRRFWAAIAVGLESEDAALDDIVGVNLLRYANVLLLRANSVWRRSRSISSMTVWGVGRRSRCGRDEGSCNPANPSRR